MHSGLPQSKTFGVTGSDYMSPEPFLMHAGTFWAVIPCSALKIAKEHDFRAP